MARIVAIAGSPSHPSKTYSLLEYATQILRKKEIKSDLISVRDFPAEDLILGHDDSPALRPAKSLVERADGLIIATPVYKASYTGVLKAFLDLLPPQALQGKVILPIVTGGSVAHLLTIDHALKPVLAELGAQYFGNSIYAIDKQILEQDKGYVELDEELEQQLQDALQEFVVAVHRIRLVPREFLYAS